jgi:hypothetical protein
LGADDASIGSIPERADASEAAQDADRKPRDDASEESNGDTGAEASRHAAEARDAGEDADAALPQFPRYYVSSSTGNDSNDGRSPDHPWKSLAKVKATTFEPGSAVLLERGDVWYEQLVASSDGSDQASITYDAYGDASAPMPLLMGSDAVDPQSWKPSFAPNVHEASADVVNCVTRNDAFLHSSWLLTSMSNDDQANRDMVGSTTDSWYFDGAKLYVNSATDPSTERFRVCTREDMIYTARFSHLVFRNIEIRDTAHYDAGYAIRTEQGDDITLEDVVTYRAGKHHIGDISTTHLTVRRARAFDLMPDQGTGGATSFVSYSIAAMPISAQWIDCTADSNGLPYPSFLVHGDGVNEVLVQNLTSYGFGPVLYAEAAAPHILVKGGKVVNGYVETTGTGVVIDGLEISGANSRVSLDGTGNILRNALVTGVQTDWWSGQQGAIVVYGSDNKVLFNTIETDPAEGRGAAIALTSDAGNATIEGNVFVGAGAVIRAFTDDPVSASIDYNLINPQSRMFTGSLSENSYALSDWQELGFDTHSIAGVPSFARVLDYHPCSGSLGTHVAGFPGEILSFEPDDADDRTRGSDVDLGAFLDVPCSLKRGN